MINAEPQLAEFADRVRRAGWVGLDTEADSLHAYPEKLCLIQISLQDEERLVDPLAGLNLAPLWAALQNHEIILHGGDYDLRLLWRHHQFAPRAVFDTMLAARLAGFQQFGLYNLVSHFFGVTMDKGPQKANWALRPLTVRMDTYARHDVHFLKPLADALRADLEQKGRLAWLEEHCARMAGESQYIPEPDPDSVWRIKGCSHLGPRALSILREIWQWREQEAIASNRPPFFILNNEVMIALSLAASSDQPTEPAIPRHLTSRRRHGLSAAVDKALSLPEESWPAMPRRIYRRGSEAEKRRFIQLMGRRDRKAQRLQLDPTLIASKAVLSALAHDWDKHLPEMMTWQQELMSRD